jgi:Flp pilus assembly pilin Flp
MGRLAIDGGTRHFVRSHVQAEQRRIRVRRRLQDEEGQTAVEYALTIALAGASVAIVAVIVGPLSGVVSDVVDTITGAI